MEDVNIRKAFDFSLSSRGLDPGSKQFARLLDRLLSIDACRQPDVCFDLLLAIPDAPEEVAALLDEARTHPELLLPSGGGFWRLGFFDACRLYRQRQLDNMKPIKPLSDGLYTCSNCGSNSTSVFKAQTRSADEGMTDFITCHSCGKKWKVNN